VPRQFGPRQRLPAGASGKAQAYSGKSGRAETVAAKRVGRPSKPPAKYGSPQSGRLLGEKPGRGGGGGDFDARIGSK
jgi:hypothetical protein